MNAQPDSNRPKQSADSFFDKTWVRVILILTMIAAAIWVIVAFVSWARKDHGSCGFVPWPMEA